MPTRITNVVFLLKDNSEDKRLSVFYICRQSFLEESKRIGEAGDCWGPQQQLDVLRKS